MMTDYKEKIRRRMGPSKTEYCEHLVDVIDNALAGGFRALERYTVDQRETAADILRGEMAKSEEMYEECKSMSEEYGYPLVLSQGEFNELWEDISKVIGAMEKRESPTIVGDLMYEIDGEWKTKLWHKFCECMRK